MNQPKGVEVSAGHATGTTPETPEPANSKFDIIS